MAVPTNRAAANAELALALPLGVVANQLMRIEADLRLLSAKNGADTDGSERSGIASQVAARLEKISETLESIRSLVADLEAQLQPRSVSASLGRRRNDRDD